MNPIEALAKGALAPMVAAGAFLFLQLQLKGAAGRALQPLSLLAGVVVGYLLLFGWPGNPWIDSVAWVFYLPVLFTVLGLIEIFWGPKWSEQTKSVVYAVVTPVLSASVILMNYAAPWSSLAVIGLAAVCGAAVYSLRTVHKVAQKSLSLVLYEITLTVMSFVILMAGSLSQAQTVGVFCAVLGVVIGWNLFFGSYAIGADRLVVTALPLCFFTFVAHLYLDVPVWMLLLLLGPLAAWPHLHRRFNFGPLWQHWAIAGGVVGLINFIALYFAFVDYGLPY